MNPLEVLGLAALLGAAYVIFHKVRARRERRADERASHLDQGE